LRVRSSKGRYEKWGVWFRWNRYAAIKMGENGHAGKKRDYKKSRGNLGVMVEMR